MRTIRVEKDLWLKEFSENAHLSVFEPDVGYEPGSLDFALMTIDEEKDAPIIYTTVKDLPKKGAYIEFGGSFPDYRGSSKVLRAFIQMTDYFRVENYKFVCFGCRNNNIPMNRLGLSAGYIPTGMLYDREKLFLEYTKEFTNG
jgi:hypothetical protein